MGWLSGIVVYVVLWWLVLFMVLPWGVQSLPDDDVARGHAAGAPRQPRLAMKMAVTSLIAAALWIVAFLIISSGWISFRDPVG